MGVMKCDANGRTIQAFQLHAGVVVSGDDGFDNLPAGNYMMIRALTCGNITLDFVGSKSITIPVIGGDDYVIGSGCVSISSDCKVVVS